MEAVELDLTRDAPAELAPAPMLPALAARVDGVRDEMVLLRRRLPVRVRPPELTPAQIDVLADAVAARLAASFEVGS